MKVFIPIKNVPKGHKFTTIRDIEFTKVSVGDGHGGLNNGEVQQFSPESRVYYDMPVKEVLIEDVKEQTPFFINENHYIKQSLNALGDNGQMWFFRGKVWVPT